MSQNSIIEKARDNLIKNGLKEREDDSIFYKRGFDEGFKVRKNLDENKIASKLNISYKMGFNEGLKQCYRQFKKNITEELSKARSEARSEGYSRGFLQKQKTSFGLGYEEGLKKKDEVTLCEINRLKQEVQDLNDLLPKYYKKGYEAGKEEFS